jgi:hypothetical protein
MAILPMVFHQETVSTISNRQFTGGLYRTISEDRTIFIGLQKRMESMSDQTFTALNIAFASNLLRYESESCQIFSNRRSNPIDVNSEEIRSMLLASKRLGYWFSSLSFEQLSIILKLRF